MRKAAQDERVPETLESEVSHILEEARMIVPGIQALFGFQFVVVYNDGFFKRLNGTQQSVHLVALCFIALAMGLVMTPAAYHRQAEQGQLTRTFAKSASAFLQAALLALGIGVALDLYLIAAQIAASAFLAGTIAVVAFATLMTLWFVYPRVARMRRES